MDNQRQNNTENKDDPSLSLMMKPVEDTEDEDEEDDEEEEEEEGEEDDTDNDDDDDDDDWVMKSKRLWSPSGSATAAPSSEPSEVNREAELEPPMVWCNNCNSDFTRSCYKLRHKRIYGCLQCGTKDGALRDASTCSQESNTHSNDQEIPKAPTTASASSQEINASNNQEIRTAKTDNRSINNAEHRLVNFQDLAVCLDDLESFQKHARQCHGVKQFREPCPDCGKFITLRNKVSGGPPHICEYKARPNSCLVCGKGFASQKGLLSHMTWVHLRGKPYIVRCLYCLKRFTFRKQKIEHEKIHHNEELKFSCPHCPLRFADLYARSAHRKTHRVFNTFTCKVCSRTFKQACKLERHMAVHTGLKPYTCKVCDRSFNQSGHLKSHMRVHTGEKPFKCQDCGQCFNHNVSLKNHVQRKHKPKAKECTTGKEEDRGEQH